jgi:hypothetical protein
MSLAAVENVLKPHGMRIYAEVHFGTGTIVFNNPVVVAGTIRLG